MMTDFTPAQARKLAHSIELEWAEPNEDSRMLRSLADQVDALTAERDALSHPKSIEADSGVIAAPTVPVVDADICLHDETERLGAIWTKCTQCGRQWADDEGGVPVAGAHPAKGTSALNEVDRIPWAWQITYASADGTTRTVVHGHNAIGDYRQIDPAATSVPLYAAPVVPAPGVVNFQQRVQPWMLACFGEVIAADREERNHRFLEEALELVQSTGCTAHEAHQLVDYVYGRPVGESAQEVGGVMVTLAALCLANGLDMHGAAEVELSRIWTKVEAIRAKQAAKPKHSPLPQAAPVAQLSELPKLAFDESHIDYIDRYGGFCRDCADEDGVCPSSGLPCGGSKKAIRHVLTALAYGVNHGYIPVILCAAPTTPKDSA